jgi:hypothetical protein
MEEQERPVSAKKEDTSLAQAAVASPTSDSMIEEVIERQRAALKRRDVFRAQMRRQFVNKLETRHRHEKVAEAKLKTFLATLSAAGGREQGLAASRYVRQGASILAANQASIQSGIQGRIKQAVLAAGVALSEEQAAEFESGNAEHKLAVATVVATELLQPKGRVRHTHYRRFPVALLCREHAPKDPCIEILEGKKAGHEGNGGHDGAGGTGSTAPGGADESVTTPTQPPSLMKADIPLLIDNLVKYMSPPESGVILDPQGRAGIGDIKNSVDGLTLHSGPADSPSFFDFHHLQIAFEHVWHELFDNNVIKGAKNLYTDLVELGVDPNEYILDIEDLLEIYANTSKSGSKKKQKSDLTGANCVYPGLIRAFDITPEQYEKIADSGFLGDLEKIAEELNRGLTTEKDPSDDLYGIPTKVTVEGGEAAHLYGPEPKFVAWLNWKRERLYHLRRQGQRLINYLDPKPDFDQLNRSHELLSDLEKAIKEPYRFSVYAANALQRSVNFGLVTTYRQQWDPESYQVGRLVKTVPLAPKEVRRFTKKLAVRKSRAEKEVENNLQVRRIESTETARAETEIVQKARKKTNFNFSAQGGLNVGIEANFSSSFGQEAATESHEAKKEFREAVFKAAEEYKQERTLEINVSTAEEMGFEESGEISNPNDEISVTYLFFELQRRYKVSEQIHGLTPVILVAQEFPRPDEIDEDWIVAHDWILRRVILDDSFVPAMNYLASKVVGDDIALREIYRNLEQQRRLTDELKEELVVTQALAGARYAALEKALQQRASAAQDEDGQGPLAPIQGVARSLSPF